MSLHPNNVPYKVPMPNNMGVMRYLLVLSVFVTHYNILTGTEYGFFIEGYDAVGCFFSLSGFLVYGSYLRRRSHAGHYLSGYFKSRALRLLPAYVTTVLFFAIVLVAVSTLPAWQYFGSWHFWKYLGANLGFVNFVEPTLPGVFEGMRMDAVNGSLWTMKIEWMLYLAVPVLVWLSARLHNRATAVLTTVYLLSAAWVVIFFHLYENSGRGIYEILGRQVFGQLCYFCSGVLIYYWFDELMRRRWLMLAVAVLCYYSVSFLDFGLGLLFRPIGLTYIVIMLSMTGRWGTWEGKRDNVSYNIYLVHWPMTQVAVVMGLPEALGDGLSFVVVLFATVVLSVLIAVLVEHPLRRYYGPRINGKRA